MREALLKEDVAITTVDEEEILVSDVRGELSPAQMVDQKLMALLWGDTGGVTELSSETLVESTRPSTRPHDA